MDMNITENKPELTGKRIVVGLSGGVDSAVAAYLLKKEGAQVIGMTMVQCDNMESAIVDAGKIADFLGIEHIVRDERCRFAQAVKGYFADEYLAGRTPNPCVMCNRHVKWASLLDTMSEYHADYIATGHYAIPLTISLLNPDEANANKCTSRKDEVMFSLRRDNGSKDQTYALCMLTREQLAHTIMPLAGMNKVKVRKIAEAAGLPVAAKPDSQDICFVPDGDYASVLGNIRPNAFADGDGNGNFVDESGNVLGPHKGITHYTIGQRKGLGLSLNKPAYVKELRLATNEVVISTVGDVFGNELICRNLNPMATTHFTDGERLTAKIRYSGLPAECTIYIDNPDSDEIRVVFDKPVRAITPGQACVFYKDDILYGGAIIEREVT